PRSCFFRKNRRGDNYPDTGGRSGRIATNLDWPNLAKKLDRYADKASIYNIRFGEEVVGWAERYMGRRL
ncbi:hypothetical protein A256_17896, partial [Pseudomonas syringae pv. actinidiae ICMP 19103]